MARPREFDESIVLVAEVRYFRSRQHGTTSVRDRAGSIGITGMGDYNAFGDKRLLYPRSLDVSQSLGDRVRRFDENLVFSEITERSVADKDRSGDVVVNSVPELEAARMSVRRRDLQPVQADDVAC